MLVLPTDHVFLNLERFDAGQADVFMLKVGLRVGCSPLMQILNGRFP